MISFRSIFPILLLITPTIARATYDPLKTQDHKVESILLDVIDPKNERNLPIRIYLPESKKPSPIIIFSHGLGGSRNNNPYLGNHWAKRGYTVVFVQHPGSDEDVWKNQAPFERMSALKKAANAQNYLARVQDIPRVLDALTKWNDEAGHPLHQRLNLNQIGMSGHSFGAQTTQAVIGQTATFPRLLPQKAHDPRLKAAVIMSPSPPQIGDPAKAFAHITVPCLLMTGTRDDNPVSKAPPSDRLKVFPYLTHAPAWQIVFDEAPHSAFGQRHPNAKPTRFHPPILALTTAFWDATLKHDPTALAWLNGEAAQASVQPKDLWQKNQRAASFKPSAR